MARVGSWLVFAAALAGCGSSTDAGSDNPDDPFVVGGAVAWSRCEAQAEHAAAPRCTGSTTEARVALAVCGALQADNTLEIDTRTLAARLAVDGTSTTSSPLTVHGSFTSFGTIDARNTATIDGQLATAADLHTSSPVQVTGDVQVAGLLDLNNTFTVGGTLQAPAGSDVSKVDGTTSLGPVQVARVLRCSEAADVGALVSAAWSSPADPAAVRDGDAVHVTHPTRLELGCGTYRLESLAVDNTLRVEVSGHVTLVVEHDVRIASPTVFVLGEGATLDWLVGGALAIDNTLDVGEVDHDATWLAVAGDVRVASPTHVYGTLFAPRSVLAGDNTLDVWGAAYVGSLRVGSPMSVHDGASVDAAGCVNAAD